MLHTYNALFYLLMSLWLCIALIMSPSQAKDTNEAVVKAAFLFNVVRMISWKEDERNQPLVFCFMGDTVFAEQVKKNIGKRRIRNRNLKFINDIKIAQVEQCNVLFIRDSWRVRMNEILTRLEDDAVLTVSDEEGFLDRGGMVMMQKEGKRINLEVDLARVEKHKIKISSRLLMLAKVRKR